MSGTGETDGGGVLMLPAKAVIESLAEGGGVLELEDGSRLRFRRNACHGFEPLPSLKVVVNAASVDAQGTRATEVLLAKEETRYERLLAEQQAPKASGTHEEPDVASALALSWVTILLNRPLAEGGALAAVAPLGLERFGISAVADGAGLKLRLGGLEVSAHPVAKRFPDAELDRRRVGPDFDVGGSFLGLGFGPAARARAQREAGAGHLDPWAASGRLRALSGLAAFLLEHGVGVVLNRAGNLVTDKETFLRLLGDLRDASCRPFAAWIDWALAEGGRRLKSSGMEVCGLPDVAVEVEPSDLWQRERRSEALLFACHRMVREDRVLDAGEVIEVPVGVQVGAYPLTPARGDVDRYLVEHREGDLWLVPEPGAMDASARWQLASKGPSPDPEQIGLNTYQALLRQALAARFPGRKIAELSPSDVPPQLPAHSVDVRERSPEGGYLLLTSGIGRVPQKGGNPERGTSHLELVAWVDQHSPQLAMLMSHMGRLVHVHQGGQDVWKPGDTVLLPEPTFGLRAFVLADFGRLPLGEGEPVTLVLVVPVTEEEYAALRRSGTGGFIAKYVLDPARAAELRQRWRAGLH